MTEKEQQNAIFWCSVLHEVIFRKDLKPSERRRILRKISQKDTVFPDGTLKKPSLSTLGRKLAIYETKGFESLVRKKRADSGQAKGVPKEVIDKAVELKKEQPKRSPEAINKFLLELYGKTLPPSTMFRHLHKAGATLIKMGLSKKKVRCRWTRDHTHDLWVGDFKDGPSVLCGTELVQTHLSAFIDSHSRFIVEGKYYYKEDFDILVDSLLRAWGVYGYPLTLYLDNAKVYRSDRLKSACYALGCEPWHRPVRDPAAGGLIERFFQTVETQFEAEIWVGSPLNLDQLNRAFSAWLAVSYHTHVHSETRQSPQDRYKSGLTVLRPVDPSRIMPYFLHKETRTVDKVFSDVRVKRFFYPVDPTLRGDKIQVWFDPHGSMKSILLYSLDDLPLGEVFRYEREKRPQPQIDASVPQPSHNYIDLLVRQHDQKIQKDAQSIDFLKVSSSRPWPFLAFADAFARMLHPKVGISSLSLRDLETLKKLHAQYPNLNQVWLSKAFARAKDKSLIDVVITLENLLCKSKTHSSKEA
jgi:putative transposase